MSHGVHVFSPDMFLGFYAFIDRTVDWQETGRESDTQQIWTGSGIETATRCRLHKAYCMWDAPRPFWIDVRKLSKNNFTGQCLPSHQTPPHPLPYHHHYHHWGQPTGQWEIGEELAHKTRQAPKSILPSSATPDLRHRFRPPQDWLSCWLVTGHSLYSSPAGCGGWAYWQRGRWAKCTLDLLQRVSSSPTSSFSILLLAWSTDVSRAWFYITPPSIALKMLHYV